MLHAFVTLTAMHLKRHITRQAKQNGYTEKINRINICKLYDALKTIDILPKQVEKTVRCVSTCSIYEDNIEVFKELNIKPFPMRDAIICLKMNPNYLLNRGYLLRELGVETVHANHIAHIMLFMSMDDVTFRNNMKISSEENISEILYGYLRREFPNISCTFRPSKDGELVYNIYKDYFEHYIRCVLNFEHSETFFGQKVYRSFKLIERMIKILREDIGYEDAVIKKHQILVKLDVRRMTRFLEHYKNRTIAGLSVKEVLLRYPTIINQNLNNIDNALFVARKYGITDDMIQKRMSILSMKEQVLARRILHLQSIPECEVWSKHPSFLPMLSEIDETLLRVEYLRMIGLLEWSTHEILSCRKCRFHSHMEKGIGIARTPYHIKYFVKKHLKEIRPSFSEMIKQDPSWKYVPPMWINDTLKFLVDRYSVDDIYNNITIILHRRETILKMHRIIRYKYRKLNFTPSQILAMCVYLMEKDNHFMGSSALMEDYHQRSQKTEEIKKPFSASNGSINEKLLDVLDQRCKIHNSI